MNQQGVTVNRTLVGVIALGLLGAAGVLIAIGHGQDMWSGACLKVGLVMGALWLALPSITRNADFGRASWTALLITIAAAVAVARSKVPIGYVVVAVATAVVIVRVLRPKRPSRDWPRTRP